MLTPLPPTTFRCPRCGWHKTVESRSDVMIRGLNRFESCPKCQHTPLAQTPASLLELAEARLRALIGK